MQICNNCNTVNEAHVEKCVHCNMKGNFRPADSKPEIFRMEKHIVMCTNCGSDTPGEGTKCIQCNFPISNKQAQLDNVDQPVTSQKVKVG